MSLGSKKVRDARIRWLWSGLAAILASFLILTFSIGASLRTVEAELRQFTEVEEPASDAAYEMEINAIGFGLGVMKYLETGDRAHLDRVAKDRRDFREFQQQYMKFATTEERKRLGVEALRLHGQFTALGDAMIATRDRQSALFEELRDRFTRIDAILDEQIQAQQQRDSPFGGAKLAISSELEADVGEAGTWLGVYLRSPRLEHRERVLDNIEDVHQHIEQLRALPLTANEEQRVHELVRLFGNHWSDTLEALAHQALSVEDSLNAMEIEFAGLRGELDHLLDEQLQRSSDRDSAIGSVGAAPIADVHNASRALLIATSIVTLVGLVFTIRRSLGTTTTRLEEESGEGQAGLERVARLEKLVSTEEEARRRIARELHDQTGQQIAALNLGVDALFRLLPETKRGPVFEALCKVADATRLLARDLRSIASGLSPAVLDDLGLSEALHRLMVEWSEQSGVRAVFLSELDDRRLSPRVETALYRIAQEALTNVWKHAEARSVVLRLELDTAETRMTIADDGCGLDPERVRSAAAEGRLGLIGMHERAALVGASIEISETSPRGTTISVRLPLVGFAGDALQASGD